MIIASIVLSSLFAIPPRAPMRTPFPHLETTARTMLQNFTAGRFEEASKDFNDSMRTTVSPATLAEMKQQIESQVGRFQTITEVHQKRADSFRVVELIARYEKSLVSFRLVFDPFDRIGAAYADPIAEPPVTPELEAAARKLIANFTAGQFETVELAFRRELRAQLPVSRLTSLSTDVAKAFGAFRSIDKVRQMTTDGLTTIEMMATYERRPARVMVVFDTYRRVAGLHIGPVPPPE